MECVNFANRLGEEQKGIWKFLRFFNTEVSQKNRLSLGEGGVKLDLLEYNGQKIWLKREDQNPNGSHKDRSLAYQVSLAREKGERELVISSSGNAAISAAKYCDAAKIKLWVFVSPNIPQEKLDQIRETNAKIILSKRSMRLSNYLAKQEKITNLRPSLNDDSIEGFKAIGLELFSEWQNIMPIFTFVTSGSSYVGMYKAFEELRKLDCVSLLPPFHVVQNLGKLAGEGGTKKTRRWPQVEEILKKTGGQVWQITDKRIMQAAEILRGKKIKTSYEGCACLAAILESKVPEGTCILTGKFYSTEVATNNDQGEVLRAESLSDIDKICQ